MTCLDELEEDALKELFNLSFGQAAATLSEMADTELLLSRPGFSIISSDDLVAEIKTMHGEAIGLVGMRYRFICSFDKTMPGMAVLLIRSKDMARFLDALSGEHIQEEMAAKVEQEVMEQVGDVLLYTCISTLSHFFATEIVSERPHYFKGQTNELAGYLAFQDAEMASETIKNQKFLLLRVDFSLLDKEVTGSLLTWLHGEGLPSLKAELDLLISSYLDVRSIPHADDPA